MEPGSMSSSPPQPAEMSPICVKPFKAADQAEVKRLVLVGLVEHWGWLDPTKNPDLTDIQKSYAGGVFLVAWNEKEIVGTGAFLPRSADTVEIVSMSVRQAYRRQGIGRMVLAELKRRARQAGYKKIVLETTQTWEDVVRFYLNNGFAITHYHDGDAHFALDL